MGERTVGILSGRSAGFSAKLDLDLRRRCQFLGLETDRTCRLAQKQFIESLCRPCPVFEPCCPAEWEAPPVSGESSGEHGEAARTEAPRDCTGVLSPTQPSSGNLLTLGGQRTSSRLQVQQPAATTKRAL